MRYCNCRGSEVSGQRLVATTPTRKLAQRTIRMTQIGMSASRLARCRKKKAMPAGIDIARERRFEERVSEARIRPPVDTTRATGASIEAPVAGWDCGTSAGWLGRDTGAVVVPQRGLLALGRAEVLERRPPRGGHRADDQARDPLAHRLVADRHAEAPEHRVVECQGGGDA